MSKLARYKFAADEFSNSANCALNADLLGELYWSGLVDLVRDDATRPGTGAWGAPIDRQRNRANGDTERSGPSGVVSGMSITLFSLKKNRKRKQAESYHYRPCTIGYEDNMRFLICLRSWLTHALRVSPVDMQRKAANTPRTNFDFGVFLA